MNTNNVLVKYQLLIANAIVLCFYMYSPDGFYNGFIGTWLILLLAILYLISFLTIPICGVMQFLYKTVIYLALGLCIAGIFLTPKERTTLYYAQNLSDHKAEAYNLKTYGDCPEAQWLITIKYSTSQPDSIGNIDFDNYSEFKFTGTLQSCTNYIGFQKQFMLDNYQRVTKVGNGDYTLMYVPKQWLKDNNLPLELSKNGKYY